MRSHVRDMIHRARQGTDAGRARGIDAPAGMDAIASRVVALARAAAAVHAAEAVKHFPIDDERRLHLSPRDRTLEGEQTQ